MIELKTSTFRKCKKVNVIECRLLLNMTNGLKLSYNQGNTKYKQYELQNIYNEFKQYRFYEITTYNINKIQKSSRTFEIRVQRSMVLPT